MSSLPTLNSGFGNPATPDTRGGHHLRSSPEASRKRSVVDIIDNTFSTSPHANENRRKAPKVSRACDLCRSKKARCNGTIPCSNCIKKRVECSYEAKYSRGRPPTPPPASAAVVGREREDMELDTQETPAAIRVRSESQGATTLQIENVHSPAENPSRASPELDVAEIEGQYFDPTSGLTFLHRAWKRLATQKSSADNEGNEKRQMWMAAGDEPFVIKGDLPLRMPQKSVARDLLTFYFEYCVVTYRFLHQPSVMTWLDTMDHNIHHEMPVWHGVGHARAAIVLTILAIASIRQEKIRGIGSPDEEISSLAISDEYFCAGRRLVTESETGLPRLESAQARLIQVLYLLQTSRMNQGWYVFGSAVQIISALALHRKSGRKRNVSGRATSSDYIHSQYRKRTFWTAYTIDAYLGVVFGRPRHYHDDDIDQDFPDCVNDEDMTQQGPCSTDAQQDCHVESLICHAKLAQIIGAISKDVYSTKRMPKTERLAAADHLGSQLRAWKSILPPHLGSIRPSSLIPSFRRQATAMKLAYSHAILHAYRPFLMRHGSPNSQRQGASLQESITECLTAAKVALQTVDSMAGDGSLFHAFWWTHYVTFCALAVVYVWEIQQGATGNPVPSSSSVDSLSSTQLFELAERCHEHLTREMTACSPSRRYSVILEELRLEAKHQSAKNTPTGGIPPTPPALHGDSLALVQFSQGGHPAMQPDVGQIYGAHGEAVAYAAVGAPWNEWQTGDWLDLDSSAFGPFSDTEGSPIFWFNEINNAS